MTKSDHLLDRLKSWTRRRTPLERSSLMGIGVGFAYGLIARLLFDSEPDHPGLVSAFSVMTVAFLILVPTILGVLTVRGDAAPTWPYRVFAPWIPVLLLVLTTLILGWEGAICVVMALPILLLLASLGGALTAVRPLRRRTTLPALLALPYLAAPVEHRMPTPHRFGETVTEIEIAAPPAVVWPLVASVDSITPEEQRWALYLALGFPKPISATLSRAGVGGVRSARFEHGLVFTETVTEWVPERRLSFTIDPNTESVPPTALDEHVTVGGLHFDVLTGTYELHPIDGGRGTRLVLRSTHRLSTRFNLYSWWWVNRVMTSIQVHIQEVHKARAERVTPS